jgi:4'-phosphopantetheinyl transferase
MSAENAGTNVSPPVVQVVPIGEIAPASRGDEVRVCIISLDSPPHPIEELHACLTPEECERAARYKIAKPRHQFVTGRGLLRQILGRCLGLRPSEVPITYTGAGKPVLAEGPLHFNVTHTDSLALIALGNRPLGIDLERVRALVAPDALVSRFFSRAEREAYTALPPELQQEGFFRAWVCKESVIKAAGLSVTCLETFDVELDPRRPPSLLSSRNTALTGSTWKIASWEPVSGYLAAVAVRDQGWE